MGNISSAGPNECVVISGGCFSGPPKYVISSWGWRWWCVSDVQRISLNVMTLTPKCHNVETKLGVALTVTGIAQVKIRSDPTLLAIAVEQFLGRSTKEVTNIVQQTMEGHLRAILGSLTVEEVFQDREMFAQLVRDVAKPDVGKMGIDILSFVVKDVYDNLQYLDSLGKTQTAVVKRDATIGKALADREATIREANNERERMDAKFAAQTKIAEYTRDFEILDAQYNTQVNEKKADSEMAYDLQAAKQRQAIRAEEIEIQVVERRKQIDIEEQEILRREKELVAKVRLPAEAEAFKVEQESAAYHFKTVALAQGNADRARAIGEAEAFALEAVGKAEAERMKLKAAAYQKYGQAALVSMAMEALPKVAAEVTAPLAKTGNVVILGQTNQITDTLTSTVAQLPPAIQALSGVDISGLLAKLGSSTKLNDSLTDANCQL